MEILSTIKYIICDLSVHQRLESIQYNGSLAITKAIRRTSKEKPCHELSFESLKSRAWCRELCFQGSVT